MVLISSNVWEKPLYVFEKRLHYKSLENLETVLKKFKTVS